MFVRKREETPSYSKRGRVRRVHTHTHTQASNGEFYGLAVAGSEEETGEQMEGEWMSERAAKSCIEAWPQGERAEADRGEAKTD